MATITFPYADPGRASFEELDTYVNKVLLSGTHPELKPAYSFPLANSTSFAQFSVVGLDANDEIAMATEDGTVQAIGVLAHAAALGASGSGNGQVFYSGCFNPDALVWHASFDTAAKREAAFRGAPTPTTIIVRSQAA